MNILQAAELLKIKATSKLNPKIKSTLGQFFTPHLISQYMASLFDKIEGDISLLDPGCGSGSLTAAFVDESIRRKKASSLNLHTFDIDSVVQPFIKETLSLCAEKSQQNGIKVNIHFTLDDFILTQTKNPGLLVSEKGAKWQPSESYLLAHQKDSYSHVIMNPPYKKIATKSEYRKKSF